MHLSLSDVAGHSRRLTRYRHQVRPDPDLVLGLCVQLLEGGHADVFGKLVAGRLIAPDATGLDFVSWDDERAAERVLEALEQEGSLDCRTAPAGRFYHFASLAKMNDARIRLGLEPGPPEIRELEEPPVISEPARLLLAALVDHYQAGRFEVLAEQFEDAVQLSADGLHQAVLELISAELLNLRSPGGILHYSLMDIPSSLALCQQTAQSPVVRTRLWPLAS